MKRMYKVETKKVDDSAHLAHASSTLLKSAKIPEDGKWHCVKSESKILTNAEILTYIREEKVLGDFRFNYNYLYFIFIPPTKDWALECFFMNPFTLNLFIPNLQV